MWSKGIHWNTLMIAKSPKHWHVRQILLDKIADGDYGISMLLSGVG
jgi:hypothetical protein